MKRIKWVVLLVLIFALVLLLVQNTAPVKASFLGLTGEMPVIVLLLLTAVGSFVSGLLVAFLIIEWRVKQREWREKQKTKS